MGFSSQVEEPPPAGSFSLWSSRSTTTTRASDSCLISYENSLGVEIIGFQQGFAHVPDQIIFRSPVNGSTLAVPCSVMLLSHGQAVELLPGQNQNQRAGFLDDPRIHHCVMGILSQAYYWLFLQPNAARSTDIWFDACVYPAGRNA